MTIIDEKLKGKKPKKKGKEPEPTKFKDIMSLLKESLEKSHQKIA